jgi:hypothetical protein
VCEHPCHVVQELLPPAPQLHPVRRPRDSWRHGLGGTVVEAGERIVLETDGLDQAAKDDRVGLLPFLESQLHVLNGRDGFVEQRPTAFEDGPLHVERTRQARPTRPAKRRDLPQRDADRFEGQNLHERLQILIGVGAVAGAAPHGFEQSEMVVVLQRANRQAGQPGEFVDLIAARTCHVTHTPIKNDEDRRIGRRLHRDWSPGRHF